jgi:hypothetical protein
LHSNINGKSNDKHKDYEDEVFKKFHFDRFG